MNYFKDIDKMYITGLPEYLQIDVDNYIRGYNENSNLLDCYYCELSASINIAECDGEISPYHANFLRYNLLKQNLSFMSDNILFIKEDYIDFIEIDNK